jgi:hypothetical protein
MLTNELKEYGILPWESRTLVMTSCLSLFPIYISIMRGLWIHTITSFGTGLISILYWQHPIHGWRRNLDLIYAKYTFLFYMFTSFWYIPLGKPTVIVLSGAVSIAYTYMLTLIYPEIWIRYHVLFHILSISMKIYIITQIPAYYINERF